MIVIVVMLSMFILHIMWPSKGLLSTKPINASKLQLLYWRMISAGIEWRHGKVGQKSMYRIGICSLCFPYQLKEMAKWAAFSGQTASFQKQVWSGTIKQLTYIIILSYSNIPVLFVLHVHSYQYSNFNLFVFVI